MAVAYYQLAVIGSILLTWLIAWRLQNRFSWACPWLPLAVAVAWSIETIELVETLKLTVVQGISIWGSFLVGQIIWKLTNKVSKLEGHLQKGMPHIGSDVIRRLESAAVKNDNYEVIAGHTHSRLLENAIKDATSDLTIGSGWVSDKVVNEKFCDAIRAAVHRGVKVRLIFGHRSPSSSSSSSSSFSESQQRGKDRLAALEKELNTSETADAIMVYDLSRTSDYHFGTHVKILICDQKYGVCGSHNWLSKTFRINPNAEISVKSTSTHFIEALDQEVSNLIRNAKRNIEEQL